MPTLNESVALPTRALSRDADIRSAITVLRSALSRTVSREGVAIQRGGLNPVRDEYAISVGKQLFASRFDDDPDEYGLERSSDHAVMTALKLLAQARALMGDQHRIPKPHVTVAPDGGVRLTWFGRKRELRAAIAPSANRQSYLYYEQPLQRGIEVNFSAITLAQRLKWLIGDGS